MTAADQLTVARAASVPLVVVLYAWSFHGHDYWATAVFCAAMTTDGINFVNEDNSRAMRFGLVE